MNKELHVSALHRAFAGSPNAGAGAERRHCRGRGAAQGTRHGAAGAGQPATGQLAWCGGLTRAPGPVPGAPDGPLNTTEGLWALENLFGNSKFVSLARIRFTNASSLIY